MIANCRTTIELLAALVDSALSSEEESALQAHMKKCDRCVEFLASYRGTSRIIRVATEVAIPPDVEERILEFLETEAKG
jgi:anti-sigma factor RsiW